MRKLCGMVLMCAALIGVMHLTASSVESKDKKASPKKDGKKAGKAKQDNSPIYEALKLLHVANTNAKSAPETDNRFGGHRNAAVKHVGHAVKELELALKYVKAKPLAKMEDVMPNDMPMHHALKVMQEALAKAKETPNDFGGHKAKAVTHMEHAIKQLHDGVEYYETHLAR